MTDPRLLDMARARVRSIRLLAIHTLIYTVVNAGVVLMIGWENQRWGVIGWGFGLAAHAIFVVFGRSGRVAMLEERAAHRLAERWERS